MRLQTLTAAAAAAVVTKRQLAVSDMPSLADITMNAPTLPTPAVATATPGTIGKIAGAPPLPGAIDRSKYPTPNVVPPTNSSLVQEWLARIDLSQVPAIPLNEWNAGDPCGQAANAQAVQNGGKDGNCWWTCGGCNRDTDTEKAGVGKDITTCPTKGTWGITYDDGPSDYTPLIVDSLATNNLTATFFVIGSGAFYRPDVVQAEILAGHHLCDHTWSHSVGLTSLTNEQIVAELAWGIEILKDITGLTPLYMRSPWGDQDDRTRAVVKAMGLQSIMWTQSPSGVDYDTNDWRIMTGTNNGTGGLDMFNTYLQMSKSIDTGFITLEHDLFQQEVDLAVGYILPAALASNDPKIKVQNIIECLGEPIQNAYKETYLNGTSSASSASSIASSTSTTGSAAASAASGSSTAASANADSAAKTNGGVSSVKIASFGWLVAFGVGALALL